MATGLSLPTSRIRPSRSAAFGVWGVEQGEPCADPGTSRPKARGRAATVNPIGGGAFPVGDNSRKAAGPQTRGAAGAAVPGGTAATLSPGATPSTRTGP